jgi:rhamnosyltransferase
MSARSVCAVIVTYHPTPRMVDNLSATYSQVDAMVVIDNGSNYDPLERLRAASRSLGFQLIENGENLGIAEALNLGVRWAMSKGHPWVILLDQDSTITEQFVERIFKTFEEAPHPQSAAIVAPTCVEADTGMKGRLMKSRRGEVLTAMTSGSLIPTRVFDRTGLFETDLFIDYVDIEFCLRLRRQGMSILESPAELRHSLGRTSCYRLLGLQFSATNHSPARRYYITRNRLVLMARYLGDFPWIWRESKAFVAEFVKILLVEDDKASKLRAVAAGIYDALRGRLGKRVSL